MNPKKVTLRFFAGEDYQVQQQVDRFLQSSTAGGYALVDVKYNYQSAEVRVDSENRLDMVVPATHGVCLVLQEEES